MARSESLTIFHDALTFFDGDQVHLRRCAVPGGDATKIWKRKSQATTNSLRLTIPQFRAAVVHDALRLQVVCPSVLH